MDETLFKIIFSIITAIGAIITYFVIPYIRTSVDLKKLEQYKEWAALAVDCAEMIWKDSGQGKDKKEYVVDFLNNLFNSEKQILTNDQINILVESAVKYMKDIVD